MLKFSIILVLIVFNLSLNGCQTIKNKSDEIVKKENKKLSQFIGQPSSELKIVMGKPDDEFKNEKGSLILIYRTKKYGIPCERKFELDENKMVIGFNSKGCF